MTTTVTYPYSWTSEVVDFADRGERALLLWVCVDCYFTEVNGEEPHETHEHDGEPCDQGSHESATNVTPGRLTETVDPDERHYFDDPDAWTEGYETQAFGTSPCDACRCGLAGSRHAVTLWLPLDD